MKSYFNFEWIVLICRRRRDDNEDVSLDKKLQAMNKMMSELFDELDADDDTKVSKEEWVRRKGNAEDYVQIVATFDKNGTLGHEC